MESAASTAQLVEQLLAKPFLPQATVYAAEKENGEDDDDEEEEEVMEEEEEEEDEVEKEEEEEKVNGVDDLPVGRQHSPPPHHQVETVVAAAAADEHSHCCAELLVEPEPASLLGLDTDGFDEEQKTKEEERQGLFITALAPSGGEDGVEVPPTAAAVVHDQAAENHNTLGTNVSDHGAAAVACSGAQQIVYVRGTETATTLAAAPLVHGGSNVVRIQIIPAESEQNTRTSPTPSTGDTVQEHEKQDCNNNNSSVRGVVSVVPKCQSAQVTVVSLGSDASSVHVQDPLEQPLPSSSSSPTSTAHVLVTVTFADRTVLSVPVSPEPPTHAPEPEPPQEVVKEEEVEEDEEEEEEAMVQKKLMATGGRPSPPALDSSTYVYYMAAMAASRDGSVPRSSTGSSSSSSSSGGSSGQCSPSDMLDSGTCSDIELTPPPLPKKMSQILKASAAIKKSIAAEPVTPSPGDTGAVVVLRQYSPALDNGSPERVINQPPDHEHQRAYERRNEAERNRQNEEQHGKHQTSDSFGGSQQQQQQQQQRQQHGSIIATDSDGSESCLSCDSLNFEHLSSCLPPPPPPPANIVAAETLPQTEEEVQVVHPADQDPEQPVRKLPPFLTGKKNGVCTLPDSLLAAIRGSRPKVYCTDDEPEDSVDEEGSDCESASHRKGRFPTLPAGQHGPAALDLNSLASAAAAVANTATTRSILMDKINSLEAGRTQPRTDQPTDDATSNYLQMHHTINDPATRAQSSCSAGSHTAESVRSNQFESDRYYKFHINERATRPDGGPSDGGMPGTIPGSPETTPSVVDDDESFAGLKDLSNGTSTIRSNKGTVRGVKNRVRNGIATFLQMQQTGLKNYKDKEAGKVVVYSTSMGIVRETYTKCMNVKQILRTLLVKFEEKDIFMSNEYQQEIKERMQVDTINIPQVFVDGQHIGDAECIERLNESGELRKMLKPYKCLESPYMCKVCGGYRLLPCPSCGGSKKSIHRNHFTAEFVALKCMNCDEVGLVKCHNC